MNLGEGILAIHNTEMALTVPFFLIENMHSAVIFSKALDRVTHHVECIFVYFIPKSLKQDRYSGMKQITKLCYLWISGNRNDFLLADFIHLSYIYNKWV